MTDKKYGVQLELPLIYDSYLPKPAPRKKVRPDCIFESPDMDAIREGLEKSVVELDGLPKPTPRKKNRPDCIFESIDLDAVKKYLDDSIVDL